MNQNEKMHIRPTFDMLEGDYQELIQILNFKEFYQLLITLKKSKIENGKFEIPSEKQYAGFIEQQRSFITKEKIGAISNKLMEMRLIGKKASDFEKFVSLQNQAINTKFDGQRARKRQQKLFIYEIGAILSNRLRSFRKKNQPDLIMKDELERLIDI